MVCHAKCPIFSLEICHQCYQTIAENQIKSEKYETCYKKLNKKCYEQNAITGMSYAKESKTARYSMRMHCVCEYMTHIIIRIQKYFYEKY